MSAFRTALAEAGPTAEKTASVPSSYILIFEVNNIIGGMGKMPADR
jgi:hypothetical protein